MGSAVLRGDAEAATHHVGGGEEGARADGDKGPRHPLLQGHHHRSAPLLFFMTFYDIFYPSKAVLVSRSTM